MAFLQKKTDQWATDLFSFFGLNPRKTPSFSSSSPEQRLERFRRAYDQIHKIYDKSSLAQSSISAIQSNLKKLTFLIQDESSSRLPLPHTCLDFVANTPKVYQVLGRIGTLAQNEAVIRQVTAFFAALIDSEHDEIIANRRFSIWLMFFVDQTCGSGNLHVDNDTECEIMELLFTIIAKIRLHPLFLQSWFQQATQAGRKDVQSKQSKFTGKTHIDEFPLCYQFIDHIHHEGRMGDFARTGLLYVFELASKLPGLEDWIVESDLPTLMASSLGALYSQLSRKLSLIHQNLPFILQLSDFPEPDGHDDAENIYSPELQSHLKTFLSYLAFWQDVLLHCASTEVKQTLLHHIHVIFLQQLLYPSILESSDSDGGSSVAILTYLTRIFDVIHQPDLLHLLLDYLLALQTPNFQSLDASIVSRKSLILVPVDDQNTNPSLFSLADLIQNSIRSSNPQTVTAALKLFTTLFDKHHPFVVGPLIESIDASDSPARTHGALNAELRAYISIATAISPYSIDASYQGHLREMQLEIEFHCCSASLLSLHSLGVTIDTHPPNQSCPLQSHSLQPDDILFAHLITLFTTFLSNDTEVNLNLTKLILVLASCPKLKLEPWLALNPQLYQFPDKDEEKITHDVAHRIQNARKEPTWSPEQAPIMLQIFEKLSNQIKLLASTIPALDESIKSRKEAFQLHDEILSSEQADKTPLQDFVYNIQKESSGKVQFPTKQVTIGHVLTNIVILQEFILELAAIIQVRASFFSEVIFVA